MLNKPADSFVIYNGTNLSHLEGKDVVVWYNGQDIGTEVNYTHTYSVVSGALSPAVSANGAIVGLAYEGLFKSMKLGSPTQDVQQILNHYKNINHIGLVMANTHQKGLRFGPEETFLDSLPDVEKGKPPSLNDYIYTAYDEQVIEFPGTWNTDARIWLKAQAPRPCTLIAVDLALEIT